MVLVPFWLVVSARTVSNDAGLFAGVRYCAPRVWKELGEMLQSHARQWTSIVACGARALPRFKEVSDNEEF